MVSAHCTTGVLNINWLNNSSNKTLLNYYWRFKTVLGFGDVEMWEIIHLIIYYWMDGWIIPRVICINLNVMKTVETKEKPRKNPLELFPKLKAQWRDLKFGKRESVVNCTSWQIPISVQLILLMEDWCCTRKS